MAASRPARHGDGLRPGRQERDRAASAGRADLYVCDRVSQCESLGELRAARAAGLMSRNAAGARRDHQRRGDGPRISPTPSPSATSPARAPRTLPSPRAPSRRRARPAQGRSSGTRPAHEAAHQAGRSRHRDPGHPAEGGADHFVGAGGAGEPFADADMGAGEAAREGRHHRGLWRTGRAPRLRSGDGRIHGSRARQSSHRRFRALRGRGAGRAGNRRMLGASGEASTISSRSWPPTSMPISVSSTAC